MQAVMNSDFAISKFHFLRRLLFVHGHWSYYRLASMVLYFFYKNVAFVLIPFWFQFVAAFSGANPIDDTVLITFNLLFNSLPPLIQGILDQDLSEKTLMRKFHLCSPSRRFSKSVHRSIGRTPESHEMPGAPKGPKAAKGA